jgi:phenylacetaldehyde dehydrogenase
MPMERDRFDEVVEGVAEIAKGIKVGDGLSADTQMGPLFSDEHLRRVSGYLESGRADGAEIVTGGSRIGDRGYFIEPTVISRTKPDMKIVREEIFGPVVLAEPSQSLDEIAATANDTVYGLGAGVWTKDISKAHAMAKRLRAGTVWINCYNIFDAALPFGGYKQSGWVREMGHEALEAYTEVKAVCTQL